MGRMPPRRRDPATAMASAIADVRAAVEPVLAWLSSDANPAAANPAAGNPAAGNPVEQPPRTVLAAAVRISLRTFADLHPGRAVEVRVPPFAAVQCLPGLTHTRGNPPNVVETDARGWLSLVTGKLSWAEALATDVVKASGHRTGELAPLLPMDYVR